MARVLSEYEFKTHRHSIYPWQKWADGQIWQVFKGIVGFAQTRDRVREQHGETSHSGKSLAWSSTGTPRPRPVSSWACQSRRHASGSSAL